jgi:putative resolvase
MIPATYVTAAHLKQLAGGIEVSNSAIRSWTKPAENPIIRSIQMPGGKRLYHQGDFLRRVNGLPEASNIDPSTIPSSPVDASRSRCIYARVSSQQQKEAGDLQRQIQTLQEAHPDHEVIQDVGSGLNFKRKGLLSLLERCLQGSVAEVVVADRDRLCRFGLELLEWFFRKCQVRLVVQNQAIPSSESGCPEAKTQELAEDLLAVCNFFVARNNGRRAGRNKRRREETKRDQSSSDESQRIPSTDQTVVFAHVEGSARDVQEVAGRCPMDVQRVC